MEAIQEITAYKDTASTKETTACKVKTIKETDITKKMDRRRSDRISRSGRFKLLEYILNSTKLTKVRKLNLYCCLFHMMQNLLTVPSNFSVTSRTVFSKVSYGNPVIQGYTANKLKSH